MAVKVSDKGLIRIGRLPLGIDNMSKDPDMPRDQLGRLQAAREMVNVDLDANGSWGRRAGFERVGDDACHSIFSAPGWEFGLIAVGTQFCIVTEDGHTTPIVNGLAPWDDITYATHEDRIYWSSATKNGIVTIEGEAKPMGVAVPEPPTLSLAPAGGMAEGTYLVTLTYQRDDGEEGGAGEPQEIFVPAGRGILLSDIPQPEDGTIERVNVYVSEANGGSELGALYPALYRSTSVAVGITQYVTGSNVMGKQLDTLFLEPVPPADIYRMLNGVLLYAKGNTVGWSLAMRPTITHLGKNTQRFSGTVDLLEPITQDAAAGVWVAARSRTWFLAGQHPTQEAGWQALLRHPYGAVPGSAVVVPAKAFTDDAAGDFIYWLDSGGHFCTGSAGGVLQRRAASRFNAGVMDRAASFFRERDGDRHVVTATRGGMNDRFQFKDSLRIRVFRNGQEID